MEILEKQTARYQDYNLPIWFKYATEVIIPVKQNLLSQIDRIPARLRTLSRPGLDNHVMSIVHATNKGPLHE